MYTLTQIVTRMTNNLEKKQPLNESLLVELVEGLIKSESKPGGPYLLNGDLDLVLNLRILKLFVLLDKALPNVKSFINDKLRNGPLHRSSELENLIDEISILEKKTVVIHSKNDDDRYLFFTNFLDSLTPEVRIGTERIGKKIVNVDTHGEITKLSSLFSESFSSQYPISTINLEKLGQANFMTWIAYSIYDSVIDGDLSPGDVSTGNILMRHALELYRQCPVSYDVVLKYITKVDSANAWEVAHCRFIINAKTFKILTIPSKDNMESLLENRAIAHIIGPVCIAIKQELEAKKLDNIKCALNYYCIARQLNDDLHDWVDDFENGRMTYVLAELFRQANITSGIHDTRKTMRTLKTLFYESELERLCLLIDSYVNKSISLLNETALNLGESDFTTAYIKPIGSSAISALKKHRLNKASVLNLNI